MRSVTTAEAVRVKWADIEANIEFPILRPRKNNAPQVLVEEEPQLEGLLYENGLLKEEVQFLRKELENWKEVCKKHVDRSLHRLVEAVDQLEGSSPAKEDEEVEKVVCPTYQEIFNQSGYIVIVHAFGTQNPTPTTEEEQEAPNVEVRKEDEQEVGLIPDIEVEEDERLQSQPSELLDHPNEGNIESN